MKHHRSTARSTLALTNFEVYPKFCFFSDSKVSCAFANHSRWAHRATQAGFPVQVLQHSQKDRMLLHSIYSLQWPRQRPGRQRELPARSCRERETHSFGVDL